MYERALLIFRRVPLLVQAKHAGGWGRLPCCWLLLLLLQQACCQRLLQRCVLLVWQPAGEAVWQPVWWAGCLAGLLHITRGHAGVQAVQ